MAYGRYYAASVDATTAEPVVSDSVSRSPSQVRRTLSCFSRKGAETTEPSPPFIAREATRQPKLMGERRMGWTGRSKSACSTISNIPTSAASPKTPKATILNAVPQAKTITMTAREEKMATSPNEEIMSAISNHAPMLIAMPYSQTSTPTQRSKTPSKCTTSLSHRSSSRKRRETASRIGVWINGVAHWDEGVLNAEQQEEGIEETGFTCVRPTLAAQYQRLVRTPYLSVKIPPGEPFVHDKTVSTITIIQPQPRRMTKAFAPARVVSKFAWAPPALALNEAETVSALEARRTPEMIPQEMPAPPHHGHILRHSRSSTSGSSAATDDASCYSRRSSATSVEATGWSCTPERLEKELPPLPPPTPERISTRPAVETDRASKSLRLNTNTDLFLMTGAPIKHSRSIPELDRCDRDFMRTAPNACKGSMCAVHHRDMTCASPTLSQAEEELHHELCQSAVERDEPAEAVPRVDSALQSETGSLKCTDSVREVMQPPVRAPPIPRRSRKRDWKGPRPARNSTALPSQQLPVRRRSEAEVKLPEGTLATTPALRKCASISLVTFGTPRDASGTLPNAPTSEHPIHNAASSGDTNKEVVEHNAIEQSVVADFDHVPSPISEVRSTSAEDVLLKILASLKTLDDLFNTAIINKGMYRVYKENEMDLIRTVAFNESPAAWEFREWCPPEERNINASDSDTASSQASQLEHTPITYMRCHRRDLVIIESLKGLILQKCQTFMRRETTFALSTPSHPHAGRFNDAFWRIWTFCHIFGCRKRREDDITGQIDWLKGGLLANNQGCVATVNTNLDLDMGSVLVNAPDHFARANAGGLHATQLYDMMEIWTCLMGLLHGYSGRVQQARLFGVFAGCDVVEGDIEKENLVLEEWLAYLMTLGPAVVLGMAEWADHPYPAGFELAKENGWTIWTPPVYMGSRSNFFKEPAAKTYEEQVALAKLRMQDPAEFEEKERSRQRVAFLAAGIRLRRQNSEFKRLPGIDMTTTERAMSLHSRTTSAASRRSPSHSRHASAATSKHLPPIPPAPISSSAVSQWASPPRRISPVFEQRGPGLREMGGIAENTSDAAIAKIVELGFTEGQARNALRMTDMGDGIRLDRAVELLIRRVA